MRPPPFAVAPLVIALTWTTALMADPGPLPGPYSTLLVSLGLIIPAVVAVAGMVMVRGRWAYRTGWAVIAFSLIVAVLRPIDTWWIAGLTTSVAGGMALGSMAGEIRKLPSATGPPVRAVIIPLVLISVPFLIGLAVPGPAVPTLAIGLTAPLAAFLFARVIFGGLVSVRVLWPALAIGLSPLLVWPGQVAAILAGTLVAAIAWNGSVKTAFHPPREVGSTFPIPPELAPKDILDAAHIDETGNPL